MLQQLDAAITSSLLLYIQEEILRQGAAFNNQSSLFYPDVNEISGLYTFTSPYRPFVGDTSISGANVMSGVYLNGNYISIGQSGLTYINHSEGAITFNTPISANTQISGNFSVAEFDVRIADGPDYKIILEDKYATNPKYSQQATGLPEDVEVFPAVILVPKRQENKSFAFMGIDNMTMVIRAVVVSENAFQRICVGNILKNLKLKNFNLISSTSPMDYLGNITGTTPYNYFNLSINSGWNPVIWDAKVIEIPEIGTYRDLTKQFSLCDLTISVFGGHQ